MSDKCVADSRPRPRKHRNHPGRESCLHQNIGQHQHREWSELGWLHHNGITTGQGGCNLPGCNHEREVPWSNQGTHPNRLPQGHFEPGILYRDGLTENLVRCSSPILKYRSDESDLTTSVANRLACIASLDDSNIF